MDPTEQDTGMTTLTEFLLARIAEDEALLAEDDYDRALTREIHARRRVVERVALATSEGILGGDRILRRMAAGYAWHPDYDAARADLPSRREIRQMDAYAARSRDCP